MGLIRNSNPYLYPDRTPERWEEKANCRGKAYELFEYQEYTSPVCIGMKYKDRMALNAANFQLAGEICIECPVMLICGETATQEEKYWTVRGGEPPGRFDEESKRYDNNGRPPGSGVIVDGVRFCNRGHRSEMGKRCVTCKNESNKRSRARKKAASGVE